MNLKSYPHTTKNVFHKKKFNFTKILKKTSLFKDPSILKHALSKGTISTKNYDLKRLGRKVKLKKIDNKSFEIKQEKRELPYELSNIIDKREKKFKRINATYQSLKKENDTFLSYWHYTQKIKEKLEKQSFQENELEKEEENDEYKKISKQYQFSNRDMIEMELQKNLTTKIFKSNPLIINNDNEMFFHFLKETNKSPNKSVNFNEQNSSRYLIKIKDFLEYISILKDENIDSLNKKIKLSNCNYTQNQEKKIEEEKIRILEEQQKTEKKEISESKDMIKDTNNLLNILNENKDYLEDPKYFSFYRNTDRKSFTPNKKIQQHLMNNSTKSDFFIGDKNHFLRKDKYDTMRILKLKKQNLSKQLNSLLNESNNKKSKRIKKLRINNINPLVDKFGNESYSKENNYSTMNMNFFNSKISNIHNNSSNSLFIQKHDNKKILPSIKNYYPYNAFTKSSISNNMQQPISLEENKNLNKKRESFNLDNTSNELNLNLNLNDETDNESESSIKSNDNQKNNEENKESDLKDEEKEKKVIIISDLYDEVKDLKNLNDERIKEINSYINQRDIEYKRNKSTVKILEDVQLVIDEFDINKIAKNFNEIKKKEYVKVKTFKKMDKKLKKLDKKYIKEIVKFKARNMKSDYKFNS